MAKKKTKNKAKKKRIPKSAMTKRHQPVKQTGPLVNIKSMSQFKQQVLHSSKPAIVDFWAPWCAPCRSMAPAFEAIAEQHHEKVVFAKVDTEANPDISEKWKIRSLPTLLAFYKGEVVDAKIGATSAGALKKWAERLEKRAAKDAQLEAAAVEETSEDSAGTEGEAKPAKKKSFLSKLFGK